MKKYITFLTIAPAWSRGSIVSLVISVIAVTGARSQEPCIKRYNARE